MPVGLLGFLKKTVHPLHNNTFKPGADGSQITMALENASLAHHDCRSPESSTFVSDLLSGEINQRGYRYMWVL